MQKRKAVIMIILALFLITFTTNLQRLTQANPDTTVIKVEPAWNEFGSANGENIVGAQFTVNITIYNVQNLYGYDLKFRWNTTYLNYVSHTVHAQWTLRLRDDPYPAEGRYWIAYSKMGEPPASGTVPIFSMTLEVIKQPYSYETGNPTAIDPIDTLLDFISTDLADQDGQPIPHEVEPATVRIWERIPLKIILKVDPPEIKQLESGTSFTVNVQIGLDPKKWNLTQFNATLSFNSTLIKATEITEGAWPKQYASTTTELLKQIDNETGNLQYALKFEPPLNSSAPSTGVLFTVTFHVVFESRVKITETPESCVIGLKPVTIIDETGEVPEEQLEITNSTYIAYRPPPVAKFTWSPFKQFLPRGQAITFNASESYQKLGLRIVNYTWDFEGVIRSTTSPVYTYTFTTVGNKTVTLNVTDEGGYWSVTKTYIGILNSPTASFKFTPSKPAVNQTIIFNATDSLPGGALYVSPEEPGYPAKIINYTWNFGDGTVISTTEKVTNYAYKHAGRYTVTLTVISNYTLSHSYSLPITISKLNSSISVNVSTTEAVVNSNVTISGEITPLRPQVNVIIYINNTAITVQTNENGQYTYKWTPTQAGAYSIKALWNGDQDTNPAESETLTVTVMEPSPPTPPVTPTGDILPFVAAAIVIIVLIILIVYIRTKRKS